MICVALFKVCFCSDTLLSSLNLFYQNTFYLLSPAYYFHLH